MATEANLENVQFFFYIKYFYRRTTTAEKILAGDRKMGNHLPIFNWAAEM